MKKKVKKAIAKNAKKFFKKTAWKLAGRIVEIAFLIGVGSALGLHLVRY